MDTDGQVLEHKTFFNTSTDFLVGYATTFCKSFHRDGVQTRLELALVHSTATSKEQ